MKHLHFLRAVLALVKRGHRHYASLALLESLLNISGSILKVVFPAAFIHLLSLDGRPGRIELIALLALVTVFLDRCHAWFKRKMDDVRVTVNLRLEKLLSEKLLDVEYALLDDPAFLDRKSGASYAVSVQKAVQNALGHMTDVMNALIATAICAVYLVGVNPVLLVVLLIGMLIGMLLGGRLNTKLSGFFKNLYSINRKFDWFSSLKTNLTYQKDIRSFKMARMLLGKIEEYNRETTDTFGRMNDVTLQSGLGIAAVNAVTLALCYVISGLRVLSDVLGPPLSLSHFVLCISLSGSLGTALNSLADDITSAFQMLGYLEPLVEVMNMPAASRRGDATLDCIETIEFVDVSFKYPMSNEYALKNISFKIEKGERFAVVGLNGSGKTTLVKLMCGLYEATSGVIRINGRAIRSFDYDLYIAHLGVVLQDYGVYDYSLADNIAMTEPADAESVRRAIGEADMPDVVDRLPRREKTVLSTQYDEKGVQLSGGEKQRLAIARALYRNGSAFIFDEPTSSLDPLAEYRAYQRYDEMTRGKLCIYISHRMATTRFCDRIVVLSEGRIVECGTHDDLLKEKHGLYRKLYLHQRDRTQA